MIVSSKNDQKKSVRQSNLKSNKKNLASNLHSNTELSSLNTESSTSVELRPKSLDDYIGQERMINQLKIILKSAKIREQMPEHILFYGQPGLGKTTVSSLIANEMSSQFKVIAAPALQKTGDVVSLLVNLEPSTVLFIDEIHRLRAPLEEVLYSAMEDKKVDLLMGKGHGASVARLDINSFMLIGATTQLGKLSKPLKDRFPTIFQLEPYSEPEILQLVERNSNLLRLSLSQEAQMLICHRSRGVPRIANNLLKRLLDYQIVHRMKKVDFMHAEDFLIELGIYEKGLTKADLTYMRALLNGTIGLRTLSGMLLEETETLELVLEPYLIYLGFLDKSSGGRKLTPKGKEFILNFDGKLVK
ncbi:MAG: Holliday junction branch migration DNA helicase RuvB [Patescibacteria group bacterium]